MKKSKITRREFLGAAAVASLASRTSVLSQAATTRINRFNLVNRHNPMLRQVEPLSPLSIGNGEFAFTCDVTGLQTIPDVYADKTPLCTMSQWGWHTAPNPENFAEDKLRLADFETYGRKVGYMSGSADQEKAFDWLRQNPHRLNLCQIGLRLITNGNSAIQVSDISKIEQKLDLWRGTIISRFLLRGEIVIVQTAVHPTLDLLAVSVESGLIESGKLFVSFAFPYGSPTMAAADWNSADKHQSQLIGKTKNRATIKRNLDNDEYFAAVEWNGGANLKKNDAHEFQLSGLPGKNKLEFVVSFTQTESPQFLPDARKTFAAGEKHWQEFWTNGAALELAESRDKRASELERRIVLSQYLTAIQCSGTTPPQETGLTTNSWYGKFHLEMHWWHAAHFALWNRLPLLEKSVEWYHSVLPSARERARKQGYTGARWAKMTAPDGRDSPSPVGTLLIWQQPHPIFYAELCYLAHPNRATLKKYQQIVNETAEFMASYAYFNRSSNRYILGPPVIPAQENHPARETWNPTFELEYWHFGLKTANKWRERLGLPRNPKWDDVIGKLSPLPSQKGVYLAHENCPQTYTERNHDHPSMLAAYGVLKGEKADREIMRRTLKKVMSEWTWADTWGWDYPMTAMTAAKLGETKIAVDALLMETEKNHYLPNGHNYQRPNLPCYLPGNGGLLYAAALMAAGWQNSPQRNAPGFPDDGSWQIRSEGFAQNIIKEI